MPPFTRLPISSEVPAAPWSVPSEPFSSARRPNSDQTWTRTRPSMPRASRSAWNAASESATSFTPVSKVCAWPEWVSNWTVSRERHAAQRDPGGDHRREPGQPRRQIAGRGARVGDGAAVDGAGVRVRAAGRCGSCWWCGRAAASGGRSRPLRPRRRPVRSRGRASGAAASPSADAESSVQLRRVSPYAVHLDREVVRLVDRRHRVPGGGERRVHLAVHRQALEWVGRVPGDVEVPAHPAGRAATRRWRPTSQ